MGTMLIFHLLAMPLGGTPVQSQSSFFSVWLISFLCQKKERDIGYILSRESFSLPAVHVLWYLHINVFFFNQGAWRNSTHLNKIKQTRFTFDIKNILASTFYVYRAEDCKDECTFSVQKCLQMWTKSDKDSSPLEMFSVRKSVNA